MLEGMKEDRTVRNKPLYREDLNADMHVETVWYSMKWQRTILHLLSKFREILRTIDIKISLWFL